VVRRLHVRGGHYNHCIASDNEYAITIKVVHAFITRGSSRDGYEDIGMFRPVNMAVSLSRREDGLEEMQMSFSQVPIFISTSRSEDVEILYTEKGFFKNFVFFQ
jgi:hypothetical protein